MKRKPIHKSRTNQTAVAGVAVAIAVAVLERNGVPVREFVESATGMPMSQVMALAAIAWGGAVVNFRQAATKGAPVDQQGKVTPR